MFTIKDKEVKAIEKNLSEAREKIKELTETNRKTALENEKLKTEKILDKKEIDKLNKKLKRLEAELNVKL
jgi:regulator of replication initiation timing